MKYQRSIRICGLVLRALSLLISVLVARPNAYAANVLYLGPSSAQSSTREQLATSARFYGLTLEIATLDSRGMDKTLILSLRRPELLAVVVSADVLPLVSPTILTNALLRRDHQIPMLVAGINQYSNTKLLSQWSNGAITGTAKCNTQLGKSWYVVAAGNGVTRQLGNTKLPLIASGISYLKFNSGVGENWLMKATLCGVESIVFAQTLIKGHEIFFASELSADDIPATPDPYRQQAVFASLAPSILFLHYASGDHGWHTNGSYANFTIDDLWLREPYGHVNYEGLLQHSQRHNFHSTIAFIPWNFDRSQAEVVSLFREHPDRLSICIHGNNHVHQEFGPLDSHPLHAQSANMQQGLARMEQFSALTKIPYDAVMVFPHSIAPAATFAELKRHHYLATANSLSVPSDALTPQGVDFALRTATLEFGNFPSLRRYSAETDIPRAQLAIDAFLGNPMLFYAHESFFATGIDAFDKTADSVNNLQPATQWQSLGSIAHHLYLERLRDDGDYEIQAFSSAIQITNLQKRNAIFHIDKNEDFSQSVKVLVDGKSYPFHRSGSHLRLDLAIDNGATKDVVIKYGDDVVLGTVDISRTSFKVNAIRRLSDFRDNTVSNTRLGRFFIRSYADNGFKWNLAFPMIVILLLCLVVVWFVRRRKRALRPRLSTFIASQPG